MQVLDLSRNNIDNITKIFGTKRILDRYFAPYKDEISGLTLVQMKYFDLSENDQLKGSLKFSLKRPNSPIVKNIAGEFDLVRLKQSGQTTYNEFYQEFSKLVLGDRYVQK